ncbi:glyoxylate reductase/hydroxypyruvate reductase [Ixodes scapularis]|uniref:glyoxylate reductase/hydroxypyruvate reductase n=1 Tax=Ixodes scapularis TaxID=6945 RepID=UPI001161AEA5|nr:glyoxylate reductase/hydroxypyruvate reductase [Ixodes scapularis]
MWRIGRPLIGKGCVLLSPSTINTLDIILVRRVRLSEMGPTRKPAVLVTHPDIPPEALKLLAERCDIDVWNQPKPIPRSLLLQRIVDKDALFCLLTEKVDAQLLDAAGSTLKVVGTMSVGYDHIDVDECRKRRIAVGNTPHVLTDSTAELGIALLLATRRRLFEARSQIDSGAWAQTSWSPMWMCGSEIRGTTVGFVGMGNIGLAILERLRAFKVSKFLYTSRSHKPTAEMEGAQFTRLDGLLRMSDIVIVTCTLTPETTGMFNREAFSLMKKTASFINISRGAVVDQDALYEALTTGKIASAGLDVMTPEPLAKDHPLVKLPNCVLLPHIGSATTETRTAMAVLTAQNILAALQGLPMPATVA